MKFLRKEDRVEAWAEYFQNTSYETFKYLIQIDYLASMMDGNVISTPCSSTALRVPGFFNECLDLNSGLDTYMAKTLQNELSPQPLYSS